MAKLLVVDDDRELVEVMAFALGRAGFEVLPAHDSPTALRLLEEHQPDAAILDINMGVWNGLDLLKTLRKRSDIVVIMLTGLSGEADKVQGLTLGADDYVTKPFSHRELVARIKAQLRRRSPAAEPEATELRVGPVRLDVARHVVEKAGQPIALTDTEFRALQYLMAHAGTVVRTRALMKQVWGYDDPSGKDTVRVTMHRLRRKLEHDPAAPDLLHTVPRVGLIFDPRPRDAFPLAT